MSSRAGGVCPCLPAALARARSNGGRRRHQASSNLIVPFLKRPPTTLRHGIRWALAAHHRPSHWTAHWVVCSTQDAGRCRLLGRCYSHRPTTRVHRLVDRVFRLEGHETTSIILRLTPQSPTWRPPAFLQLYTAHITYSSRAGSPSFANGCPLSWSSTAHCTWAKHTHRHERARCTH